MTDLEILAAEAARRGITYGKLMQVTTARERELIIERHFEALEKMREAEGYSPVLKNKRRRRRRKKNVQI